MFEKRIGITQKLIKHPDYDETLAALDVNWFDLIRLIGAFPVPIPPIDEEVTKEILESMRLDGLILSGGNSLARLEDGTKELKELSKKRDKFEYSLLKNAVFMQYPIIGVCRGMQVINSYFDGNFTKISGHVSSRHKIVQSPEQKNIILHEEVNSYHNFSIPSNSLGSGLEALALDLGHNIEAFHHNKFKILGIMWHPEREKPFKKVDLDLIKGHFEL